MLRSVPKPEASTSSSHTAAGAKNPRATLAEAASTRSTTTATSPATATPATSAGETSAPSGKVPWPRLRSGLQSWREQPVLSYYLLLVCTLLLFIIGFILVFSASTIQALDNGANPFRAFGTRTVIYVASLFIMFVASRIPPGFYFQGHRYFLGAAWVMQLLIFVPGLAASAGGNTNWIMIPGIRMTLQPSEFIKLALAVYLGRVLTDPRLRENLWDWRMWLRLVGGPAVGSLVLVLLGKDLGTAMVMASLVLVAVFAAGLPLKYFGIIILVGLFGATVGVLSSANRRRRVFGFLDASTSDPTGIGYQRQHGLWSLATGGLTGVGPGASREKWSYLPEADTDYIFAILGEEFGILGTFLVLALFAVMCVTLVRIMQRSESNFPTFTVAAMIGWIFAQAIINIAAVIGLFPIIGVPLPLVSSGGSSLLSIMAALGIAMSFARREPGAEAALKARGRPLRKSQAILGGAPKRSRVRNRD